MTEVKKDETENIRRELQQITNQEVQSDDPVAERARLEAEHGAGNVWSTDELRDQFDVHGFMAPFVSVRKKDTKEEGTLQFQHHPRFYFGWVPNKPRA